MVMTHLIINPCKITAFVILQPSCTTTALIVKEPAQPEAHFRAPRAVNCKRIESSASAGLKSCLKLYVQKILAVNILLSDAERVAVVFLLRCLFETYFTVFPNLNEFKCLHSYCFMGEFLGCIYNSRRLLVS